MQEGRRKRSVEVSGRTVDQAIESALEELGVDRDQVETEVLAEGSRGILGLGAEKARVRVTLVGSPPFPRGDEEEPSREDEGDVAEIASDVLSSLLRHMYVDARVVVRQDTGGDATEPLILDVEGDNLGILIGRQGETLRDLQYITRLIVSRKLQRWANVLVDAGGYKRRRERVLAELAERMADRVVAEGRPVTLEPMPPHERRIVHITLRDHDRVTTESTGEGHRRKVVILPKREF
jgi:spoIIIJ-associated protein